MDLVSVIISNYNYDKYIAEAIESVLKQTYQNFELIIIDDGSTDKSVEIIDSYKEKYSDKIEAIFQENEGQASAFNKGFENSKGQIIAFLDADDYWYPNKLETIVYYHQKYDGIQHNLLINNEKKFTVLEDKVCKQKKAWEEYGYWGKIPTSSLSFRKDKLEFVFPIEANDLKVCADWYMKVMFLNEYDLFSIDEPLGYYRVHESNSWFNSREKYRAYGDFILEKANEYRNKRNKKFIEREGNKETNNRYMLSCLNLNSREKYVMYGTGSLAQFFYEHLNKQYDIVCFSNSFLKNDEDDVFMELPCRSLDYLLSNKEQYDKIIVASEMLGDIEAFLFEKGIPAEKIVMPKI